jgi:hypothetical protein
MSRAVRQRGRGALVVEGVRAAVGIMHLVIARPGAAHDDDRPGSDDSVAFHRLLGARQLAQAGLLLRVGSADAHTLGAAVDAVHAVSMLPLLVVDRRRRRLAGRQFLVATAFAVAEVALVGRGGGRR